MGADSTTRVGIAPDRIREVAGSSWHPSRRTLTVVNSASPTAPAPVTSNHPDASQPGAIGRASLVVRPLLAPFAPSTWVAFAYLAVDAMWSLVTTSVMVALVTATVATVFFPPAAIALAAFAFAFSNGLARVTRWIAATALNESLPSPHPPRAAVHPPATMTPATMTPGTGGDAAPSPPSTLRQATDRGVAYLKQTGTWKELIFHLLHAPVSWLFFTIAVAVWAVGIALVLVPLYTPRSPGGAGNLLFVSLDGAVEYTVAAGVGLALVLIAPWLTRGLSTVLLSLTRQIISTDLIELELRERVDTLETTRAGALHAAEVERRRIERDLHDGAQQRLVALAMTLGLARQKVDGDREELRSLLDEAHGEAKAALTELRDLARGLHPPVLTDRGLAAAVGGLAARSPVPVAVDVQLDVRPPRAIESTAYFVISESLTNVARHSGATRSSVRVFEVRPPGSGKDHLVVEVADDGHGGASDPTAGAPSIGEPAARGLEPTQRSGLLGLRERVEAVDGLLTVSSPPGGPTVLRAVLPVPPPSPPTPPPPIEPSSSPLESARRITEGPSS